MRLRVARQLIVRKIGAGPQRRNRFFGRRFNLFGTGWNLAEIPFEGAGKPQRSLRPFITIIHREK